MRLVSSYTWLGSAHLISGPHRDMRCLMRVRDQTLPGKSSRDKKQPSLLQLSPFLWVSLGVHSHYLSGIIVPSNIPVHRNPG